jgi:gamma-glutamyltranspeptidase/glutathione hydrolase
MNNKNNIAFTAPHWLATEAGIAILKEGGTATEAMVTAAAVISVVYPHMNSIAGDGFWLIDNINQTNKDSSPIAIDACGQAANDISAYQDLSNIPSRGGLSALTQAGTISGWQLALAKDLHGKLPLSRLLAPAIHHAKKGFKVSDSLAKASTLLSKVAETNKAFKNLYQSEGELLTTGSTFKNTALANVFEHLSMHGLQSFYQGELAQSFAEDLSRANSPLTYNDLTHTQANIVKPLHTQLSNVDCFNLPAPTQGIHSLQILAMMDRLKLQAKTDADWVHLIVEATKQSFSLRPKIWADIKSVSSTYQQALSSSLISELTANIDLHRAKSWPFSTEPGDTVWMGARDSQGQMVSFIQSIYWEFGSGVAMQDGGFVWNNRGVSFDLNNDINNDSINVLTPNKKPAHTLNPPFSKFSDGRRLAYGTMGGEGQPQTQAAIFTGIAWRNKTIEQAIAEPRWLLGRTWGDNSSNLKVEAALASSISSELDIRQHDWQVVEDNNEMMGHAGAILDSNTQLEAATDPRSNGQASVDIATNLT